MSTTFEDTYFFDYEKALEVAEQQNRIIPYNLLQICYYDGEERDTRLKNLIWLPINSLPERLIGLGTRIPTKVVFKLNETKNQESDYNQYKFQIALYNQIREEQHLNNIVQIKKVQLNFNEPLRIYIGADFGSQVVLSYYKMIKDSFLSFGCDVFYDENSDIELNDDFRRSTCLLLYKPHITININRLRNNQLCNDMINIIWFQDPTLILYDDTTIKVRDRDFIFYAIDEFKNALLKKGVQKSKLFKQVFTVDEKKFYLKSEIKRENKIIFIGSNFFDSNVFLNGYKENQFVVEQLMHLIDNCLSTPEAIDDLAEILLKDKKIRSREHLNMFIYPSVGRLEVVKWICKYSPIPVEIYGNGWENIEEVKPFYKGFINKDKIPDLYNSAKYSLLIPSHSFYQQRLAEALLCGTINFAWDDPNLRDKFNYRDSIVVFKDRNDISQNLAKEPVYIDSNLIQSVSNKSFIKRILSIAENFKEGLNV